MPINHLFNLFGNSPIHALQKHMDTVYNCANHLLPFFEAILKKDWTFSYEQLKHIDNLERAADEAKKSLRLQMPKSLFLPVPRTDLLELLVIQDEIANISQDIAGLVYHRRMQFPVVITPPYMQLLECCIQAIKQAHQTIQELDKLLETGFRGNEVDIINHMTITLHTIEEDSDQKQAALYHLLFSLESTLPPIDVMFLYKTVEWTGNLANQAHRLGEQIELLLAH